MARFNSVSGSSFCVEKYSLKTTLSCLPMNSPLNMSAFRMTALFMMHVIYHKGHHPRHNSADSVSSSEMFCRPTRELTERVSRTLEAAWMQARSETWSKCKSAVLTWWDLRMWVSRETLPYLVRWRSVCARKFIDMMPSANLRHELPRFVLRQSDPETQVSLKIYCICTSPM